MFLKLEMLNENLRAEVTCPIYEINSENVSRIIKEIDKIKKNINELKKRRLEIPHNFNIEGS